MNKLLLTVGVLLLSGCAGFSEWVDRALIPTGDAVVKTVADVASADSNIERIIYGVTGIVTVLGTITGVYVKRKRAAKKESDASDDAR